MGASTPQESGRKAPLSCNAAFSMLRCSFSVVAAQCSRKANVAVQLLQYNFPKIAAQLPFSHVACCKGGV